MFVAYGASRGCARRCLRGRRATVAFTRLALPLSFGPPLPSPALFIFPSVPPSGVGGFLPFSGVGLGGLADLMVVDLQRVVTACAFTPRVVIVGSPLILRYPFGYLGVVSVRLSSARVQRSHLALASFAGLGLAPWMRCTRSWRWATPSLTWGKMPKTSH